MVIVLYSTNYLYFPNLYFRNESTLMALFFCLKSCKLWTDRHKWLKSHLMISIISHFVILGTFIPQIWYSPNHDKCIRNFKPCYVSVNVCMFATYFIVTPTLLNEASIIFFKSSSLLSVVKRCWIKNNYNLKSIQCICNSKSSKFF